jgi:Flp pilus assembly protein TadD
VNPTSGDNARRSARPSRAPSHKRGGLRSSGMLSSVEEDADATATDWQIILHLKALFERDPTLISALLEDSDEKQSAAHATTILAAAREALAACPDEADLHYHAARAAARSGKKHDAEALLRRALELNPSDVNALVLLADVCMGLDEPHRAVACLQRALAAGAVSHDRLPPVEHDRSGNELST